MSSDVLSEWGQQRVEKFLEEKQGSPATFLDHCRFLIHEVLMWMAIGTLLFIVIFFGVTIWFAIQLLLGESSLSTVLRFGGVIVLSVIVLWVLVISAQYIGDEWWYPEEGLYA